MVDERPVCMSDDAGERTNKMRVEGKTSGRDAAGKNLRVITVFGALLDFQMCNNGHERASKHNCNQQASNVEWSNQMQTLAYFRFQDNPIGSKWARFILRRAHVKPLQCNGELLTSRRLRNAVCADWLNTVATYRNLFIFYNRTTIACIWTENQLSFSAFGSHAHASCQPVSPKVVFVVRTVSVACHLQPMAICGVLRLPINVATSACRWSMRESIILIDQNILCISSIGLVARFVLLDRLRSYHSIRWVYCFTAT